MSDIELPTDWEAFGPCMKALPTDRMRGFVYCYVQNGGHLARAAAQAGYSSDTATSAATRLMHDDRILDALAECTWKSFNGMGVMAVRALEPILKNPLHKHHMKAIDSVLDRVLPNKPVDDKQESSEDMVNRLLLFCEKTGADPKALLGPLAEKVLRLAAKPVVAEAEVVEVVPPRQKGHVKKTPPAPVKTGLEGLEDVL